MRSYEQLLEEIKFRKEHGLPRIELTREERVAAFGDTRTPPDYDAYLADRLRQGLVMSLADKRRARAWIREQNKVLDTQKQCEENSNCSPRTLTSRR